MIAIVDYGMGNLRSVQKGFERVGHAATITSDPAVVADAEKVVLPGVGAFGDAMAELQRRGLVEAVKNAIADDKPPATAPNMLATNSAANERSASVSYSSLTMAPRVSTRFGGGGLSSGIRACVPSAESTIERKIAAAATCP